LILLQSPSLNNFTEARTVSRGFFGLYSAEFLSLPFHYYIKSLLFILFSIAARFVTIAFIYMATLRVISILSFHRYRYI